MNIGKLDSAWTVNGTPIYCPGPDTQISHENVVGAKSGRGEDGVMHIIWVRRDILKVSLNYKALTGEEWRYLKNLMQGKDYQFSCPDGSGHCYTGSGMKYTFYGNQKAFPKYPGGIYTGVTIDVIEM